MSIATETRERLEWHRLCQHLATFAATKLGKAAAQYLVPAGDRQTSDRLLAQTREAYHLETEVAEGLSFDGVADISGFLERAELQGILSGSELEAIAATLAGARRLRRHIEARDDLPILAELVADLRTYPEIEREIGHCIDDGKVADRASPELGAIRDALKQQRDRIYQTLNRIMQRQANALQENLITTRGDRFVLPVRSDRKDAIRGIVHDTSTTGATLYIEPNAIVELNNKMRSSRRRERDEEEKILRQLSEQVAAIVPDLERLLAIVTTLDLAVARARYGLWLAANPPQFTDDDSLPMTLRQLRHPLLVWQQKYEQGVDVVPIDLVVPPEVRVVTITGPNTGGKTVTLKTLGLAVLMAKSGMFVPAKEPVELPWFDDVLADIGDEQSIEQNLSTFSGHIRRIVRILDRISEAMETANYPEGRTPFAPTLVLLDEVGAGTDPSEGSALAMSLLQHLADRTQLTMATTHFGELKALKYQDDRFENASVEFDEATLSPTYRLLWGIPGRSNALTIARRLGLAEIAIERAKEYLLPGGSIDIERTIAGLEAQRRQQEIKAEQAAEIVERAERLEREIAEKAETLQQQEERLKFEQEKAVREQIDRAKETIAAVIRKLQQGTPTGQDAQAATEAVDRAANEYLPSRKQPPKPKPGFRPQVGDRVRIPRLGQTAEVLTSPDEDDKITVRFGLMKMSVGVEDIESLKGEKVEPQPKPKAKATTIAIPKLAPTVRTESNTIDIRGSRVSDAEVELEGAIAQAVPRGGAVWIVHGKGTGKLRQGVHEFLDRSPHIKYYELAAEKEGGSGVTIAYLG